MAAMTGDLSTSLARHIVRREGKWVYLDDAYARSHPLYGIKGWAKLLFVLLILGGLLGLLGSAIAPFYYGLKGIAFGLAAAGFSAYSIFAATRLGQERESFQRHYLIITIASAASSAAWLVYDLNQLKDSITTIVINGLWMAYVFRSVRVNVTTRKRVLATDPLVRDMLGELDQRRPQSAEP